MSKVKIWHNPRCGKSRDALKIVEANGNETEIVKYLDNTPNVDELKETLNILGISARELMRTKEKIYKELDLRNETDEEKLIEAMVNNPKLIERPVLFKDGKAIIGRPTEVVQGFLEL